jgi:hypothetical protein
VKTAALTVRATTPAELDAIDCWVVNCWLEAPVGPLSRDGVLRVSIEQSPQEVDPEPPRGLPRPRNHRQTAWYEEYEQPVVVCSLTIHHVERILDAPAEGLPLFRGIEFDQAGRVLRFDGDVLLVRVSELELELAVMPEPVRWARKRFWQIGPLNFETGG